MIAEPTTIAAAMLIQACRSALAFFAASFIFRPCSGSLGEYAAVTYRPREDVSRPAALLICRAHFKEVPMRALQSMVRRTALMLVLPLATPLAAAPATPYGEEIQAYYEDHLAELFVCFTRTRN